jgi:hypothetical protein
MLKKKKKIFETVRMTTQLFEAKFNVVTTSELTKTGK